MYFAQVYAIRVKKKFNFFLSEGGMMVEKLRGLLSIVNNGRHVWRKYLSCCCCCLVVIFNSPPHLYRWFIGFYIVVSICHLMIFFPAYRVQIWIIAALTNLARMAALAKILRPMNTCASVRKDFPEWIVKWWIIYVPLHLVFMAALVLKRTLADLIAPVHPVGLARRVK